MSKYPDYAIDVVTATRNGKLENKTFEVRNGNGELLFSVADVVGTGIHLKDCSTTPITAFYTWREAEILANLIIDLLTGQERVRDEASSPVPRPEVRVDDEEIPF